MLGIEPAQTGYRAVFEGEWTRLQSIMEEEWEAMLSRFREDPSKGAAAIAKEVEGLNKGLNAVPPRTKVVEEGGRGERGAEAVLGLLCFPLVLLGQVRPYTLNFVFRDIKDGYIYSIYYIAKGRKNVYNVKYIYIYIYVSVCCDWCVNRWVRRRGWR